MPNRWSFQTLAIWNRFQTLQCATAWFPVLRTYKSSCGSLSSPSGVFGRSSDDGFSSVASAKDKITIYSLFWYRFRQFLLYLLHLFSPSLQNSSHFIEVSSISLLFGDASILSPASRVSSLDDELDLGLERCVGWSMLRRDVDDQKKANFHRTTTRRLEEDYNFLNLWTLNLVKLGSRLFVLFDFTFITFYLANILSWSRYT